MPRRGGDTIPFCLGLHLVYSFCSSEEVLSQCMPNENEARMNETVADCRILAAGVDWKTVKNETDMSDLLSHLLDQLYSSKPKPKK